MSQWEVVYGVWIAGGRVMRKAMTVEANTEEAAIAAAAKRQKHMDRLQGRAPVGHFIDARARQLEDDSLEAV
jgi:hypothetical protein